MLAVTDEALSTAAFCDHPYKRVAVSAWPVRALSERGKLDEASRTLMRSLAEAGHIQHPISKMDALELLWHAAWLPPIDGGEQALSELVKACEAAESWKSGRCLRNIVGVIGRDNPAYATRIIASMAGSGYKRQAVRWFASECSFGVRSFYW